MTDECVRTQTKSRQTWFNSMGTIKNVHARFNVWIPQSKSVSPPPPSNIWQREPVYEVLLLAPGRSVDLQEAPLRAKVILPAMRLNCFTNESASYIIKNPTGELFTYTPSGKVRTPTGFETNWSIPIISHRYHSLTESDGLCCQVSSTVWNQTAGRPAFLLKGHRTL